MCANHSSQQQPRCIRHVSYTARFAANPPIDRALAQLAEPRAHLRLAASLDRTSLRVGRELR